MRDLLIAFVHVRSDARVRDARKFIVFEVPIVNDKDKKYSLCSKEGEINEIRWMSDQLEANIAVRSLYLS